MRAHIIGSAKCRYAELAAVHKAHLGERAVIVGDECGGDDYASNVPKTVASIILAAGDEWSLHLDCDAHVDVRACERLVDTLDPLKVWGKRIACWPQDPSLVYLSGPCYLLHRAVRSVLIRHLVRTPDAVEFGDVALGLAMRRAGVQSGELPISFEHYVSVERLRNLYGERPESLVK